MNDAEQLMQSFYAALNRKDYTAMHACYSPDIIFQDPAFGLLRGEEAFAMWEMLCKNATDLQVESHDISVPDEYGTCNWTAIYTFSRTNRKITNQVKAYMRIQDHKIIEHTDQFDINAWIHQAFGPMGWLLGWTTFFQRAVQHKARKQLKRFLQKKQDNQTLSSIHE